MREQLIPYALNCSMLRWIIKKTLASDVGFDRAVGQFFDGHMGDGTSMSYKLFALFSHNCLDPLSTRDVLCCVSTAHPHSGCTLNTWRPREGIPSPRPNKYDQIGHKKVSIATEQQGSRLD